MLINVKKGDEIVCLDLDFQMQFENIYYGNMKQSIFKSLSET